MIDVHSHILPALDDGAIDLDDSLAMARTAEDDGIEVVCATPHIHPDRQAGGDVRERLEALVERGALIQVTSKLIAEGPASPVLIELAGHGLVHLLGSDAHSARAGRPVRLSDGLARLGEVDCVRPHLDWVARDGPRAILAGEKVSPPFLPC